jgi:DNA-binding FadR family transcriptional regulator
MSLQYDLTHQEQVMDQAIRPIRRTKLYDEVVAEIGRRIANGSFAANTNLPTEYELAASFGVSRNLLREAIKVLLSKGMIEVRPKTGTRVLPVENWNILDPDVTGWLISSEQGTVAAFNLTEFRLIAEPKASYLAAIRATSADIAEMRRACAELEACVGYPERVPAVDAVFHSSIYRASHNMLLQHFGKLIGRLHEAQVVLTNQGQGSFELGLPLHREVTEAIAARNPAAAAAASRALCYLGYQKMIENLGPDHLDGFLGPNI